LLLVWGKTAGKIDSLYEIVLGVQCLAAGKGELLLRLRVGRDQFRSPQGEGAC
jgi:hypothetical protein